MPPPEAVPAHGTLRAAGRSWKAHHCAQLHHGLVPVARPRPMDEPRGLGEEATAARGGRRINSQREYASEDARHVRIEDGDDLSERDACDGGRSVLPHAGETAKLARRRGDGAGAVGDESASRLVERPCAAVVSEPRPRGQHIVERRRG